VKRAVSAVLAAMLLAACGSDDDGDGGERIDPTQTETATPRPDTALFRSERVGFTFEYPNHFVRERAPGVLGQVSVAKGEFFNAIKVREAADRELPPERYLDDFQRDFERRVSDVDQREETIGEIDAGVLEFRDAHAERGKEVEFNSASYFFTGAGRTWQVECVAEAGHRDEIDAACEAALESVEFKSGK
jgi:hypothetical protein